MSFQEPDIYSGFSNNPPEIYNDAGYDEAFQNALRTSSYGKRNPTTAFVRDTATKLLTTGEGRTTTGRPSTSVRAVGYTSDGLHNFNKTFQASKKAAVIETKKDLSPEEKYKDIEKKIYKTLEESILISSGVKPDITGGLTKAKKALSLDRSLLRMKEQNGDAFTYNFELTYSVLFNIAESYTLNEMYAEALSTYSLITKNKKFPNVNRLKLNVGNIYFRLGKFSKAIKMYKMGLDQVPRNQTELRLKITHNIGILFIKMGQYSDAAIRFEFIMSEKGDWKTGLHLILCYYAIGDVVGMRRAFQLLLENAEHLNEEENDEAFKRDELYLYENKTRKLAEKNILMAANLIASLIEDDFNEGYNWCLDVIRNSAYSKLASELDFNKAVMFLRQSDSNQAIESLKYFEKKESPIATNAVINLSFIYLLKKDLTNSQKYTEIGKTLDSYNPVYVNSGINEMLKENFLGAKKMFENALEIDSTSFEALYNLGLVYKRMRDFDTALVYFRKIHDNISPEQNFQVIYQIGNIFAMLGDTRAALEWYLQLLGIIHFDVELLEKIGEIYEMLSDRQQAFQYNLESYRIFPANLGVIDWIGAHFLDLQVAEKAIIFYEKSVLNNPTDLHLLIRVASCYRRFGSPKKSLKLFQAIHKEYPDNEDCLKSLIYLAQSQGLSELFQQYNEQYQNLLKLKEVRQRIGSSRPNSRPATRSSSIRSSGSTNHESDGFTVAYTDPLGPPPSNFRPRTGMKKTTSEESDDDEMNPEELLPM